ncbi:DUF4199 domain-containing protein [Polaribacter sp.]|nr:DUF4199 domain-containing protein [Polaribacter sp.]
MNQLIKSKGQNFGLFYGIFLIFLTLYAYAIDINFFVSYWFLIFVIISFFVNAFWVMGSLKKAQAGLMSFKEGFTVFFISNALALLLSTLFTLLLFTIIDPELQDTVKELTIIKTTEAMEYFNVRMDQISIEEIRNQDNFSIVSQIKGYFSTLAICSIAGLLIALILKKKEEENY